MTFFTFIVVLAVLILAHELGHFLVAKKSGIRVDEFGIGFPPRLWSFKHGETLYSLNLIPFGGYVRIFGEQINTDTLTGPDSARSFVNKSRWTQSAVLLAGVTANFLLAWFLFTAGLISGLPTAFDDRFDRDSYHDLRTVVTFVEPASPAADAGLKAGDIITGISDSLVDLPITRPEDISEFIKTHAGNDLEIRLIRDGQAMSVNAKPVTAEIGGLPRIGVAMAEIGFLRLAFPAAFVEGARLTYGVTEATIIAFSHFLSGLFRGETGLADLTGPVGIASLVGQAREMGFSYLLSFTAFISINLAVLNLLPFPALDGGRLLFVVIEGLTRRRIPARVVNILNSVGFAMLLALMITVTYRDIVRLIS
jgi:regulator of sigma E protease